MMRDEKRLSFLGAWHWALGGVLFLQSRLGVECCGSPLSCCSEAQTEPGPRTQ